MSAAAAPLAVAHRGDPHAAPENTMGAFASAVAAGADMVELDLKRARDGTIVVVHDDTLVRIFGVERAVSEMTAAEIATVHAGEWGIPTLGAVLASVALPLMVDFTEGDVVEGALDVVRAADALDRCLFVTEDIAALRQLRRLEPSARLGVTWTNPVAPEPKLLSELNAAFFNPMFLLVDEAVVAAMHEHGLSVSTWTVDEADWMGRMIDARVDAIVSNRIARLRSVIDGR